MVSFVTLFNITRIIRKHNLEKHCKDNESHKVSSSVQGQFRWKILCQKSIFLGATFLGNSCCSAGCLELLDHIHLLVSEDPPGEAKNSGGKLSKGGLRQPFQPTSKL